MTATEILKMIENVNPNQPDVLREINDRVYEYLHNSYRGQHMGNTEYCSSRDALKAIRPEGWGFSYADIVLNGEINAAMARLSNLARLSKLSLIRGTHFNAIAKTEELAELHAIIQAIEYSRQEKQND